MTLSTTKNTGDKVSNTEWNEAATRANTVESFIDQDVTTSASPTFAAATITGDLTVDGGTLFVDASTDIVEVASGVDNGFTVTGGGQNILGKFSSTDIFGALHLTDGLGDSYFITRNNVTQIGGTLGDSANNLVINSSGQVGIGTTSPGAKFEVQQDSASLGVLIDMNANAESFRIDHLSNDFAFRINSNSDLANGKSTLAIVGNAARTTATSYLFDVNEDQATTTQTVARIRNDGTGNGLFIDQNGNGIALNIDNAGSGNSLIINTSDFVVDSSGNTTVGGDLTVSGGFMNYALGSELTISSGAVTATQSYHTIDTEGDAASDDLDTINGGTVGDFLFIRPATSSRDIIIKHNTGNILTQTNADVSLDTTNTGKLFFYNGTFWIEIGGRVS